MHVVSSESSEPSTSPDPQGAAAAPGAPAPAPSSSSLTPVLPAAPGASRPPRELPRTLGRYTLFESIGRGGMAEIYLARAETELGATRLSVVKQILPAFAGDSRFAEMLIHEAKLAARLTHRRIVQVVDLGHAGETADGLYIAMEYVEGFDLNALLRMCTEKQVGLPAPFALGIVADVLEGLDYAHRRTDDEGRPLGIVHRDVSPSNVLISYEGDVKLCDFGIAHANDLVRDGGGEALKGKAGYMSPEHARGESIDARADVFAAGIILWELLAGHRLYRAKSDEPLLEQAKRATIPPLADKGLPHPELLAKIVERALARDRDERYPSAAAFLRDLEEYLASSSMLASRLKLGEWIAESFGTALVERRRASERRLPKSMPPPRRKSEPPPSEVVAVAAAPAEPPQASPASSEETASADDPEDVLSAVRTAERARDALPSSLLASPVSAGAMRAFKRELESARRTSDAEATFAAAALVDTSDEDPGPLSRRNIQILEKAQPLERPANEPTSGTPRIVVALAIVAVVAALVAVVRVLVQ